MGLGNAESWRRGAGWGNAAAAAWGAERPSLAPPHAAQGLCSGAGNAWAQTQP